MRKDSKTLRRNECVDTNRRIRIIAAIPAYDEEATIAKVLLGVRKYVDEVVVCDDGSTDMTGEIARAMGATVVKHQKNLGKGAALRTLFSEALKMDADLIVTLDADGQHDPKEIPQLIEAMRVNSADIIIGSRFIKEKSNVGNTIPGHRLLGNKVLSFFTDRRLADTQSGFRVYSRVAIAHLKPTVKGMGADSEILMKAKEIGLKTTEVPIKAIYGVYRPSKRNFLYQTAEVFQSIIKRGSVQRPLLFYGLPGFFALVLSLGLWMWSFQAFMTHGIQYPGITRAAIGTTALGLILIVMAIALSRLLTIISEESAKGKQSR